MPKLGVLGSLVWDVIYGRDPAAPPVEEWGGIAYALAGFDAALPDDWEIVPLIKVGSDLRDRAADLIRSLAHVAPGVRCVEVPVPNNRVVLRYQSAERRCERMSGGVPGWTWSELGPMVRDLDALYVNFISGFEMELGTAQALRQAYRRPIYGDLHSLFLGMPQDGIRVLQTVERSAGVASVLRRGSGERGRNAPALARPDGARRGRHRGGSLVAAGDPRPRGSVYVAAPGFDGWAGRSISSTAVRTELIPAPPVDSLDPTGCGDVFGAAMMSRLLAGDGPQSATREATRLAARNAMLRGASDLARLLRGRLATASATSSV